MVEVDSYSDVLHDWRLLARLKDKIYKTTIKSTITYEVECSLIKKQEIDKTSGLEMNKC